MLNSAIRVKKDSFIQGSGLVADRLIRAGEILFKFDDLKPPVHLYEIVDWPPEERIRFLAYASQIGADDFSFKQGDIKFINHSCDPTGWWEGYGALVARRDIKPGEEVTYDYSTTDIKLSYRMKCMCGSGSCRGIVTSRDYLDPDFQKTYANHLPAHVVDAIKGIQPNGAVSREELVEQAPGYVAEAVRQAKLEVLESRGSFSDQYIFEIFKKVIDQVRSNDPEFYSKHGGKYVFEMVREVIVKS